jgi:hypothetical protein
MLFKSIFLLLVFVAVSSGFAFPPLQTQRQRGSSEALKVSRRDLMDQALVTSAAMLAFGMMVESANASGGATAGGAYLLSAKQRYNERVKQAVKGLLDAQAALATGNSKPAKAYFSSEEGGSWKDLTAAGYLLSNAFRRTSTTPPDKYVVEIPIRVRILCRFQHG